MLSQTGLRKMDECARSVADRSLAQLPRDGGNPRQLHSPIRISTGAAEAVALGSGQRLYMASGREQRLQSGVWNPDVKTTRIPVAASTQSPQAPRLPHGASEYPELIAHRSRSAKVPGLPYLGLNVGWSRRTVVPQAQSWFPGGNSP